MQRKLIILAFLLLIASLLPAQIRKEMQQLEKRYQSGNIDEMAERLPNLKPTNDAERAFISYYAALLKKDKAEALTLHKRLTELFPNTLHGQKSLLELSKIYILDRDFASARNSLRQINSPELTERMYWLGLAAYGLDDFSVAIANSENYLRLAPTGEYVENAHYLIIDSYMEQKKYSNATQSLNKLAKVANIDKQYHAYKLGLCYEYQGNITEAVVHYRRAYEMDKYSQVAYQVEEHLFNLRAKKHNLDLSFLYPYAPLEIAVADSLAVESVEKPSTPPPTVQEAPAEPAASLAYRLPGKPQSGLWLQAGRFNVESNAERHCKSIRAMGISAQYFEEMHQGKKNWVVLAGAFPSKDEANIAKEQLAKADINSFNVKY